MSSIQKFPGFKIFISNRSAFIFSGMVYLISNCRQASIFSFDLTTVSYSPLKALTPPTRTTNSLPSFFTQKLTLYVSPGLALNSLQNPGESRPPVSEHARTANFSDCFPSLNSFVSIRMSKSPDGTVFFRLVRPAFSCHFHSDFLMRLCVRHSEDLFAHRVNDTLAPDGFREG